MKKIELISGVLSVITVTGYLMGFPAFKMLSALLMMILFLLYFFFGFALLNNIGFRNIFSKNSYNESAGRKIAGAIGSGFILSMLVMGIMYKLFFWPGADIVIFSAVVTGITALAICVFLYSRTGSYHLRAIYRRLLIFSLAGSLLLFIPTPVLIRFYFHQDPELGELRVKMFENPAHIEYSQAFWKKMEERDLKRIHQKENEGR